MIKSLLAYILSLLSFILLAPIISFALYPLVIIGNKFRSLARVVTFSTSLVSVFSSLYIFVWVCEKMSITPTLLMFLIPLALVLVNDFRRIAWARTGSTPVRTALIEQGDSYDTDLQVKMGYGYLFGDIFGVVYIIFVEGPFPWY
jgi:hypothetical protein